MKKMVMGEIGVVYGDIGKRKIYDLREDINEEEKNGIMERRDIIGVV